MAKTNVLRREFVKIYEDEQEKYFESWELLGSYFGVVGILYNKTHFTYIQIVLSEFKNIMKYVE